MKTLRETGLSGRLRLTSSINEVTPRGLYRLSAVVGALSVPGILDTTRYQSHLLTYF